MMDLKITISYKDLGARLKLLRAHAGLTLRQVEAKSGKSISNAYLSQLERGVIKNPTLDSLKAIAAVYDVTLGALVYDEARAALEDPESLKLRIAELTMEVDDLRGRLSKIAALCPQ